MFNLCSESTKNFRDVEYPSHEQDLVYTIVHVYHSNLILYLGEGPLARRSS